MNLKRKSLISLISSSATSSGVMKKMRRGKSLPKTLALGVGGLCALYAARAAIRKWTEYDLSGKTVLITGGSRGLGLVLAREFVREGANVVICARDRAELQRAAIELAYLGGPALAIPCNLTDQSQVQMLVRTTQEHFGKVDVLVNNAGMINVGPIDVMTVEDYEEAMETNYWGSLYTILAVLPDMRLRGEGRIVNISSIGGKISVPHLLPYSASKFALTGLSEGLRSELKKDGITVTTVFPGLMRTGSPRNATFKGQHRAEYAWFSISDALPLTSMSAERAARRIVTACKRGEASVVLSIQAKLATLLHALFPGVTTDMLAQVNRLLPTPGGIGKERAKGEESESSISPSWLTRLSDEAALRNNQIQ
jgi:NAD(P)-dependent dehydrogenase (short-subunit alcohol dehydrogenase family)